MHYFLSFQTDPNDPNGPDLDTKIDELRHAIRRAEVKHENKYIYIQIVLYLFIYRDFLSNTDGKTQSRGENRVSSTWWRFVIICLQL